MDIFLKFYVKLLKKVLLRISLAKHQYYKKKENYKIEKIIKENKEKDEFLVKQKGFPDEENTQEPRKYLKGV